MPETESEQQKKDRFAKALGEAIREARTEAGPSQEDFANSLKIDRTTISLIERGKQVPNVWTLYRLSEQLEVSASELLERALLRLTKD